MSSKPIRIMFVDDDLVTGKIMKRNCDHAKYRCEVFQDAESCLKAFQTDGADISGLLICFYRAYYIRR